MPCGRRPTAGAVLLLLSAGAVRTTDAVATHGRRRLDAEPVRVSSDNNYTCSLYSFLPFTTVSASSGRTQSAVPFVNFENNDNPGYNQLVAAVLAIRAFNEKSVDLVPELALYHDCPVTIDWDHSLFFDTGTVGHRAAQALFRTGAAPCAIAGPYNDGPALDLQTMSTAAQIPQVVTRAYNNRIASQEHGPYTTMVFPDMHSSLDMVVRFLEQWNRTNYISLLHSLDDSALQRREALGMTLDQRGLSTDNTQSNKTKTRRQKVSWNAYGYDIGIAKREPIDALRAIKEKGYRTIIVAMNDPRTELELIANAAEELGMNNRDAIERGDTDYFWIFWGTLDPEDITSASDNIPQLIMGAVWFVPNFLEQSGLWMAWNKLANDTEAATALLDTVNRLSPIQNPDEPGYFQGSKDYFARNDIEAGAGLLFDAILSIGLGACLAYYEEASLTPTLLDRVEEYTPYIIDAFYTAPTGTGLPTMKDYKGNLSAEFFVPATPGQNLDGDPVNKDNEQAPIEFTSATHAKMIRDVQFYGASGYVHYLNPDTTATANEQNSDASASDGENGDPSNSDQTNNDRIEFANGYTRNPIGFPTLAVNLLPRSKVRDTVAPNESDVVVDFEFSHIFFPAEHPDDGFWFEFVPYIYAHGTSVPPTLLRTTPEQNFLTRGIHVFGLASMTSIMLLALGFAVWVTVNRNHKVLKASQPYFLYMLFIGATITSSAIFNLSFDESYGWSETSLSMMCTIVPWQISIGIIITYGALFAKLWRVNRVLQFTRQKIDIRHVAWPIALLVGAALCVLSTWTAVDPLVWTRVTLDEATGESIGKCGSHHAGPFGASLVGVMAIPVVLTGYMAWKTKDVDHAYSEAYWIFVLIFVQVEVMLVSVPVVVILDDVSADGRYLGFGSMVSVVSFSSMLLVMLPKLIAFYHKEDASSGLRSAVGAGKVRVTGVNDADAANKRISASHLSAISASRSSHASAPKRSSELRDSCGTTDGTPERGNTNGSRDETVVLVTQPASVEYVEQQKQTPIPDHWGLTAPQPTRASTTTYTGNVTSLSDDRV